MAATASRYGRDRQRHRMVQTVIVFATALILAFSLSSLLSAQSHASIDCTARSMRSSSSQCPAPAAENHQR